MSKPEVERVAQLAYLSALRGTDSTGMAFGFRKKKEQGKFGVCVHKMVEPSPVYIADPMTQRLLDSHVFFIMGHCRATTIGESTLENAHPHEVEHITGTHNGTIAYWGNKEKSDSRVLFERLAKDGVAKAFGDADNGAYATVFADRRARTINFYRNDKRPLYIVWNKSGSSMLWASEKEMLQLVAARTNFEMALSHDKKNEPWLLRPHCLYSIPFGTTQDKADEVAPIKPVVEAPVRRAYFPPSGTPVFPRANFDPSFKDDVDDWDTIEKRLDRSLAGKTSELHQSRSLHSFPPGRHYDATYYRCIPLKKLILTREDADLALLCGCAACGTSKKADDTSVTWYNSDQFLCEKCNDSDFAQIFAVKKSDEGEEVTCG